MIARLHLWRRSLPARLLALTALFVMLAEVLIFAPSVGRFRLDYLDRRLSDAHLALLAVEARPDGMLDMSLQMRLLSHAGAISMTAWQPGKPALALHPLSSRPMSVPQPWARYDLREEGFFSLIGDALRGLITTEDRAIEVIGLSPVDDRVLVQVLLPETPMLMEMRAYGMRVLILSAFISLITAALVYISLLWLLVRPMRRLSASMHAFCEAPEDAQRVIVPSRRGDEVALAEQALCTMQTRLRDALRQQARLAAVGRGVAKISHDLKGVLTTALLESDRLEASAADPEVKAVTQGIARALERAVTLTSSTLRFATEQPSVPHLVPVDLRPLLEEVAEGCGRGLQWQIVGQTGGPVRADPEAILRILDNLARNATQAGASVLTVTLQDGRPSEWAQVVVADNGPGLPPKARENLFVPFSGSARPGGSGLGLPIARELAESQGGRLSLLRSGADGTAFVLEVPRLA